jgi:hypothetical protein
MVLGRGVPRQDSGSFNLQLRGLTRNRSDTPAESRTFGRLPVSGCRRSLDGRLWRKTDRALRRESGGSNVTGSYEETSYEN